MAIFPLANKSVEIPELNEETRLSIINNIVKAVAYAGTLPNHTPNIQSAPTKNGQPIRSINIKENFVDIINNSSVRSILPTA